MNASCGDGRGCILQCSEGLLREVPPKGKWVTSWSPKRFVSFKKYSPRSVFTRTLEMGAEPTFSIKLNVGWQVRYPGPLLLRVL